MKEMSKAPPNAKFDEARPVNRTLSGSENKYRTLIEQASDGIHTYDFEGNFIETNSRLCEMLGYTPEELLRLNVKDLVPAEDLAVNPIRFDELRAGKTLLAERRLLRKDGTLLPVEISGKMIEGGVLQSIIRDISERKRAEERLKQSEEWLRNIFESSHDGILVEDNEIISYVNKSYIDLFGYDEPSELIGQHISIVISPEDIERVTDYGKARLRGEQPPLKYELKGRRKDGTTVEVEASVSVSSAGHHTYITTIIRDITERKRLTSLLDAQKQALEMVVAGSPLTEILEYLANIVERQSAGASVASLLLLDEHGRLYNGASPSLPDDYLQAIEGLEANENLGTCSRAAAIGEMVMTPDIAADPKWQDIKHFPLKLGLQSAWSMPITASNGRVLGTFGTYFREKREATELERQTVEILARAAALAIERKRAEDILHKYQNDLEEKVRERTRELDSANKNLQIENRQRHLVEKERVRLLEQLVSTQEDERRRIARDLHDHLGQQLTAIRLKLEILKSASGDNENLSGQIDALLEAAKKVDADVDFLAWELRPSALDDIGLAAAIERYVREWSKHFEISADFNASRFDQRRLAPEAETNLYRIVQEALNNIAKHARAKNVDLSLASRDDCAALVIEDDGDGFSPEVQVFSEESVKGMGLIGMRERAALVGGTLEIESAKGKGTTVYIRIPISSEKRG